jgi:hypothetical protein
LLCCGLRGIWLLSRGGLLALERGNGEGGLRWPFWRRIGVYLAGWRRGRVVSCYNDDGLLGACGGKVGRLTEPQ